MDNKIPVMIAGLPGKLATAVAREIIASPDFRLFHYGLTGENMPESVEVDEHKVNLVSPGDRYMFADHIKTPANLSVVDFTHPDFVVGNVDFYCERGWHPVVGTTMKKETRDALEARVKASRSSALVAPNFAAQIVAGQKVIAEVVNNYLEQGKGYTLNGWESHQAPKKDISGTWRAIAREFVRMGVDADIKKLDEYKVTPGQDARIEIGPGSELFVARNPDTQHALGVPAEHLKWHGWHEYTVKAGKEISALDGLISTMTEFLGADSEDVFGDYDLEREPGLLRRVARDGSVVFSAEVLAPAGMRIRHTVNGGKIYADGVMRGLRYQVPRIAAGDVGNVKTMVDIISA